MRKRAGIMNSAAEAEVSLLPPLAVRWARLVYAAGEAWRMEYQQEARDRPQSSPQASG